MGGYANCESNKRNVSNITTGNQLAHHKDNILIYKKFPIY